MRYILHTYLMMTMAAMLLSSCSYYEYKRVYSMPTPDMDKWVTNMTKEELCDYRGQFPIGTRFPKKVKDEMDRRGIELMSCFDEE